LDKETLSASQGLGLMLGFVVGTALLLVPSSSILTARQDAWTAPLLAAVPGLLLLALLLALNKMYPGQSLVQYSEAVLGLPGKAVSLLFIWFAFHLSALVLRNIEDFVSALILFETPPNLVLFVMMVVSAFALRLGIETVSRALCLLLPAVILFFFVIQSYSMFFSDFKNLSPVIEPGILASVIKAGLSVTSFPAGEIVLFGMLIFHIKPKKIGRNLSAGLLMALGILAETIMRTIVTIGPGPGGRSLFAIAKGINFMAGGGLLLPFNALNWFVFSVIKFLLCYYAFVLAVAHWAKLPDYKPLILPAGAMIMTFAVYAYGNAVEEVFFATKIWLVYAIPIEFGIPLLLWLAAVIRKKFMPSKGSGPAP